MGDMASAAPAEDREREIGAVLLARARAAIARELGRETGPLPDHPGLSDMGASFVTLTEAGQLRGCIGTLSAVRALRDDVDRNAVNAAFRDPRFMPLSSDELDTVHVEVSVLSEPEFMQFTSEADALAQLRPGVDGVIFSSGCRQATFLPQVWESLPEVHDFMAHLKRKAGLPSDFWGPDVTLARYQVRKFKESATG
jgi:AmmeMemoRadiSam system protein A